MSVMREKELQSVQYGSHFINFTCVEAERKTLGITVFPDMEVLVSAPLNTDIGIVKTKVQKKARWILRKQKYFAQFFPRTPKRLFIGGETHLYLGRQYRLKLVKSKNPSVKLLGRFLFVYSSDLRPKKVEILLNQWYREKARIKFSERLNLCHQNFNKYNIILPELQIREMSMRWGSMTSRGRLILNSELIKAPIKCVDYVITHELCHLIFKDHNQKFYQLLNNIMSDWENRKFKLENLLK